MGFLNPLLALGMLGVSIPVLVHLLNRYREKRIPWAAMDLLRQAVRVRAWQVRVEDWLLLALRCLAVLLVTAALARPVLSPPGGRILGGEPTAGAVIAIDASFSMSHTPGGASRFERAIERAKLVAQSLRSGDPVTLVLMGRQPRVLLRNAAYEPARFETALSEAAVSSESLNVEANLDKMKELLPELKAAQRELYLITDGQTTTWGQLSEQARGALADLGKLAVVRILPIEATSADNVGITRLELASGTLRQGSIARYVAEVRNFGPSAAQKIDVSLFMDDVRVDQHTIEKLGPGESFIQALFAPLTRGGQFALRAQIAADALAADNSRCAVVQVRPITRVLAVDGDPANEPFRGATGYLATALRPRDDAETSRSLVVNPISWLSLPAQKLEDWDVVVLANIAEVPAEQAAALLQFVQRGGGLIFFPGDNVNPAVMNKRLRVGEVSLLPAELLEATGEGTGTSEQPGSWPIDLNFADHPLTRILRLLPPDLLSEARVSRYLKVKPADDARTVLSLAGAGAPLVLEKSIGRGRVVLVTTTANRAWNTLAVHPMYPLLLQQAVTWLTRQANETPVVAGQSLSLPADSRAAGESVAVRDPAGAQSSAMVVQHSGGRFVETESLPKPGFYSIQADKSGPPLVVATNVDAGESDVKCLDAVALRQALGNAPVQVVGPRQDLVGVIREGRVGRELWRPFLIAGLALLVIEAIVARRLSRSRGLKRKAERREAALV